MIRSKVPPDEKLGFDNLKGIELTISRGGDYVKCLLRVEFGDGYRCHNVFTTDLPTKTTLNNVESFMDAVRTEVQQLCINRQHEIKNGSDTSKAFAHLPESKTYMVANGKTRSV
jgi:hypothetical protein